MVREGSGAAAGPRRNRLHTCTHNICRRERVVLSKYAVLSPRILPWMRQFNWYQEKQQERTKKKTFCRLAKTEVTTHNDDMYDDIMPGLIWIFRV